MIARRLRRTTGASVVAVLLVCIAAGTAAAAFSAKTATAKATASTLKLEPPSQLVGTCPRSNGQRTPVVTFTSSASKGVVADHPDRSPAQVFGYVTSLAVNGVVGAGGYSVLGAQATGWTGPSQQAGDTLQLSIVSIYGNWISSIASVTFKC